MNSGKIESLFYGILYMLCMLYVIVISIDVSTPLRSSLLRFLVRVFARRIIPFTQKMGQEGWNLRNMVFRTFDIEKIDLPFVPAFQIGTDNAKIIILRNRWTRKWNLTDQYYLQLSHMLFLSPFYARPHPSVPVRTCPNTSKLKNQGKITGKFSEWYVPVWSCSR